MTMLETGICFTATCIHPPGAAHKSTSTRDFWRNSNFRFNWISLNAARERYPEEKNVVLIKIIDYDFLDKKYGPTLYRFSYQSP